MSVYSRNVGSALESVDINSLLENEIEASFEESSVEAAARAVCETAQNWNSIIEACAIDELNFLEENGTEMVYEGAKLDAFFDKAKEILSKIWEKIQSIFKKVLAQFNLWFQSDKDFLKKYKKELDTARVGEDKEVKFFDYVYYANGAELSKDFTGAATAFTATDLNGALDQFNMASFKPAKDDVEGWKELNTKLNDADTKKKIYDTMRGAYIDGKEVEAGEFGKLYKEKLQGSDSKDNVKLASVLAKCVTFLGQSDKIKANLGKALAVNKKSIDNAIKCIDSIKKALVAELGKDTDREKEGAMHSVATTVIEILKTNKTILTTANGIELECLKACSRQSKAICVAAITYKPKAANESGMFLEESDSSLLSKVNLV